MAFTDKERERIYQTALAQAKRDKPATVPVLKAAA